MDDADAVSARLVAEARVLTDRLLTRWLNGGDERLFDLYDQAVRRWARRHVNRQEHFARVLGVTQDYLAHRERDRARRAARERRALVQRREAARVRSS